MGKDKLNRFKENKALGNVYEPSRENLLDGFSLKGNWNSTVFKNNNPIVLELGCGHGDYTVALGKENPKKNYIGIDIKGARLWKGAKWSAENNHSNIAFLRMQIELLDWAFTENEVSEIWITFPDPQILYRRRKHRLTHLLLLETYRKVLTKEGIIHLKTDDAFLHGYTLGLLENSKNEIVVSSHDVYGRPSEKIPEEVFEIKTHYEKAFLEKGKLITYIQFRLG